MIRSYVYFWSVNNLMGVTEGEIQKKILVIFVEGQTDKEFYKKLVNHLRDKYPDKKTAEVVYRNLKSVYNYKSAGRVFQNEILKNNGNAIYTVICSYDFDVFKNCCKIQPPIDWNKVKKELNKQKNVIKVIEIRAHDSIEDWFLIDIEGLCKYLKAAQIPKLKELKGKNGQEKIENLFIRNKKIYQKGYNVNKFIDILNFNLIYNKLEEQLKHLVEALFI